MNSLEFTKTATKLSEYHPSESKNQATEGNAVLHQTNSHSDQLIQSSGDVADDGGEMNDDGVVVRTSSDITPINQGSILKSVNNQSDVMQQSAIASRQAH